MADSQIKYSCNTMGVNDLWCSALELITLLHNVSYLKLDIQTISSVAIIAFSNSIERYVQVKDMF